MVIESGHGKLSVLSWQQAETVHLMNDGTENGSTIDYGCGASSHPLSYTKSAYDALASQYILNDD